MFSLRKFDSSSFLALSQLWQFYEAHNSYYSDEDIDNNGRYDIDDDYLKDVSNGNEECEGYFILFDEKIAGFVTIETTELEEQELKELSDIFILPKYRGKGLAHAAVQDLMFGVEANIWHVAVYKEDRMAHDFWQHMFKKLSVKEVRLVTSEEGEEFFEYIVKNK
ncbi:GNAT family N-acetyltransferase [Pleionea sp. CnH1-48]|uniref:GNAT family N-acetyltransferase n=1 Tax=Pleionea sp. CnH1-48 TaxID=2954494 RepID=UPI0020970044|nr:GNAT family N-acetyltransferase [Pleionea sp. CnH1-48]MCO7224314.1 GNAT family N-acetyltransferase [Pleionea sp. CnH1-48]